MCTGTYFTFHRIYNCVALVQVASKRKQKYFITNSNGLNFKYIWLKAFDFHMLFSFYCLFAYYSALDVLDDFNSPVFTAKLVKQKINLSISNTNIV